MAKNVTMDNESAVAGVTDNLLLENNLYDINLGLVNNKQFDLSVENYISKVTIETANNTQEINYDNTTLAKAEIKSKEVEGAKVKVEYTIIVKNNGAVAGSVEKIIDTLPQGLEIDKSSLSTWTKNVDGTYINTSLSNNQIEPGKSVEIKLIATRTMTENSTGTLTNKVTIEGIQNNLDLKETNTQNNKAQSELILSISTGAIIYISIAAG